MITTYRKVMMLKSDEYKGEAQEKTALFVLYFGPDDDSSSKEIAKDLVDRNTNKGKNNLLVEFVEKLHSDIIQFMYYRELQIDYKNDRSKCYQCLSGETGEIDETKIYCQKDEYTVFTVDDCKEFQNNIDGKIKSVKNFGIDLLSRLQELSEIMRIYCKIEWKKAKEGK